jgi:hypothetical protein
MGWVESPAYFCAVTECARDLTQHFIDNKTDLPYHPVEELMTIPDVPPRSRADSPTKLLQVYVDNFCHAAIQSKDGKHLATVRRAAIHGIHAVFPEPDITNHKNSKEPISRGKLERGDKNFDTTKTLIGFVSIESTHGMPPEGQGREIYQGSTCHATTSGNFLEIIPNNSGQSSTRGSHPAGNPVVLQPTE